MTPFTKSGLQKKSISTVLIIYLALLIALISGLASLLNYTFYTTKLVRDFEVQYQDDVDYLADLLTVPVWNYEQKTVESLCRAFLKTDGTLAVSLVLDNQQTLSYGIDPAGLGEAKTLSRELKYEDNGLGTLKVYYSVENILNRARDSQIKFLLTIVLVIVITAVAITLIVKRLITRPFSQLQENILAISDGDFSPLDVNFQHRETQSIADAFNYMCAELLLREEEISQRGQFLQTILDGMPSPLLILNQNLDITQFNVATQTFFNQLGLTMENGLSLVDAAFLGNYREQVAQVMESGKALQLSKESLSSFAGELYVNIVIYPIRYRRKTNVAIRIDDITSVENQSNALVQAQKMEVVGTLAGGLAHDFNNVLGIIGGSASLLELKAKNDKLDTDAASKLVERIKNANDRAILMIQQLLTLGKQHHMEKKFVDLEIVLANCLELGMASFDKSIKIDFNREGREKNCYGDAAKLEQAFLNLLINASHAMTIMRDKGQTWGGVLSINIDKVFADKFFVREFPEAQNETYWQVSVSDTGIGIQHKALAKIFDPFFTTKESEKGTGLGLSMIRNIINSHEGFVKVYSEPGAGTTFNIYLPTVAEGADQNVETKQPEIGKLSGTLLLVDDEAEIRAIAVEMAKYLGMQVLEAENGQLAIEKYQQHQNEVDLILMDLVMPLRSGRDATEEILKLNPKAKIIMTSGFRKDFRISEALQIGALDFLHKPYSLEQLYQVLTKYLPDRS